MDPFFTDMCFRHATAQLSYATQLTITGMHFSVSRLLGRAHHYYLLQRSSHAEEAAAHATILFVRA